MTSQADFTRPPRTATSLIKLFVSAEEESILGDLLEKHSDLALKSGVAVARRWYWRQALKTIAHLAGYGLRRTPWSTAAIALGGVLLLRFVSVLPERAIFAVLEKYQVAEHHFDGICAYVDPISFAAALATATGREMVTAMALGLILCLMTIAASLVWVGSGHDSIMWMLPWYFADWFAIVIGGAIVRTCRLAAAF